MQQYEAKKIVGRKLTACSSEEKNGQHYLLLDFEDEGGRRVRLSVASSTKMAPKVRAVTETRERRGAWGNGASRRPPA